MTNFKQRYVVEGIFGIPLPQGSLAKLHQWFCAALQPAYEQWWSWIQQPGVRCVDGTSYRLNGVNHWIWIATAPECCVLFFVPTRSSAEVKTLWGEDSTVARNIRGAGVVGVAARCR